MPFATVEEAIADLRQGKIVIIVDDEERENEGDLVLAAEHVTPEAINFMARQGGFICLALTGDQLDRLGVPLMIAAEHNTSPNGMAFACAVDAKHNIESGMSARDRAETIRVMIDPATTGDDIIMPGHVFPLRARSGGILERQGHTEASIELARMASLTPAAVLCEIICEDGTMARMTTLEQFAEQHQLRIVSIADMIAYRLQEEGVQGAAGLQIEARS